MTFPWITVRVFISSTFRDMQAERDWLVRFVFPRLREELLPQRIHLVDVDLRWGVTSYQDVLGVCREIIDECRPRFMGILGGRYGWVPPGRTESITADEIHYGVLGREADKRGQAFFYFRAPQATADIVEKTPGDFRETDGSDAAGKLAALKQAIADAGLPVFRYPAQWDAAEQRLTGLEAFGNQVHADLLQSLKDDPELATRFTGESDAAPDEFAEEAEQMEAFIEERTERYVIGSREPLLREMLTFASADGTPNIFVLTGDPGSGKSALLAKFTRDLAALHPSSFILPTFVGASIGSTDLRRTLRRLCPELARAAGNTERLPLDIKDIITHFQKLLTEAAGRQRVILVFDALNQFDATDGAHWLNWLPRELPRGVRIIASTLKHPVLHALEGRGDAVRIVKLESLTQADTLAVIEGYLRRYAKRLSPEQLAALLAKPASHLPLYALTALEELRTLGTYEEITARIRELPGDARALFGWILTERLARDPGFRDRERRPCSAALVEKFAACLGVSRHGLSPAELTALLDPGDPLGNVAALLRLLRPYLMRRGELLDFYHGQFREAATNEFLPTEAIRRASHDRLAFYFIESTDPVRGAPELIWHLVGAKQFEVFSALVTEPHLALAYLENDRELLLECWARVERDSTLTIATAYRPLLEHPPTEDTVISLCRLCLEVGQEAECVAPLRAHIHRLQTEDDRPGLLRALRQLGQIYKVRGDEAELAAISRDQAALEASLNEPQSLLDRWGNLAHVARTEKNLPRELALHQQMERAARDSDDRPSLHGALSNQATVLLLQGHSDAALSCALEAVQLARETGQDDALAHHLCVQGDVLLSRRESLNALTCFHEAETICRQRGYRHVLARTLFKKAFTEFQERLSPNALLSAREAHTLFADMRRPQEAQAAARLVGSIRQAINGAVLG